jgi:hypothetical protein
MNGKLVPMENVLLCLGEVDDMNKKFCNSRYITRGIQYEVPLTVQEFLWSCIESLQDEMELDYLQVFNLKIEKSDEGYIQIIVHEQEVPEYRMTYRISCTETIDAKIFAIDDGYHSTMLLAKEY